MAERSFLKNFEDFRGLDVTSSELTLDQNIALEFNNWDHVGKMQLAGRKGHKGVANFNTVSATRSPQRIANYTYTDALRGRVEELLVILSDGLWTFKGKGTIQIDNVGANVGSYQFLFNPTANEYQAIIKDNGATIFTGNLGDGLGSGPQVVALVAGINGLANYNCTLSGYVPTAEDQQRSAVTFTLQDETTIASGSSLTISFAYFILVSSGGTRITSRDAASMAYSSAQLPSFLNYNNNFYYAGGGPLLKYDGNRSYLTGVLPGIKPSLQLFATGTAVVAPTIDLGGAGLSIGRYRYIVQYKFIDARGKIYYGSLSDYAEGNTTAGNLQIRATVAQVPNSMGFCTEGFARISGKAALVITTTAPHNFQVGDSAYYLDATTGQAVIRKVASIPAADQIQLDADSPATTVFATNGLDHINNAVSYRIWRTLVNGVDFYALTTWIPTDNNTTARVLVDQVTDTTLQANEQLTIPDYDADLLDISVGWIAQHQGRMVVAPSIYGGSATTVPADPLSIRYNETDLTVGNLESFPIENTIVVPATTAGGITGITSDNDNMLAVFKEDSYYNVVGDLGPDGAINIISVSEGDIGCASGHTIVKLAEFGVVFLSYRGPCLLKDGKISETWGEPLMAAFEDSWNGQLSTLDLGATSSSITPPAGKLLCQRAVAINDYLRGEYVLAVPAVEGSWGYPTPDWYIDAANSRTFVFNYRYKQWKEWTYQADGITYNPIAMGGFAIVNREFYFASQGIFNTPVAAGIGLFQVNKRHNNTVPTKPEWDYIDHNKAILNKIRTGGLHLDEPSLFKEFLRYKLYQFRTKSFIPFTLLLRTYKDWITSTVHSESSMRFDASTTKEIESKLKVEKARALSFELTSSTAHECPRITGYEIAVAAPYMKDALNAK